MMTENRRALALVRAGHGGLAALWEWVSGPAGLTAVAVGLLLVALLGCGGGGDPSSDPAPGSLDGGPGGTYPETAPTTGADAAAAAALADLALTVEDMPTGWAELPLTDAPPLCAPALGDVRVAFAAHTNTGPAVGEQLAAGGADTYTAMADALDGCVDDAGGLHYELSRLNVGPVGDESAGYRATITDSAAGSNAGTQDVVLFRVRDVVGIVTVVNQTGDTADMVTSYATMAVERIRGAR